MKEREQFTRIGQKTAVARQPVIFATALSPAGPLAKWGLPQGGGARSRQLPLYPRVAADSHGKFPSWTFIAAAVGLGFAYRPVELPFIGIFSGAFTWILHLLGSHSPANTSEASLSA